MKRFRLLWISAAATTGLTLVGCGQSTPPLRNMVPNAFLQVQGSTTRRIITHFNISGTPAGSHFISLDEYDAIVGYLLSIGADPSPENIDRVHHGMRH